MIACWLPNAEKHNSTHKKTANYAVFLCVKHLALGVKLGPVHTN